MEHYLAPQNALCFEATDDFDLTAGSLNFSEAEVDASNDFIGMNFAGPAGMRFYTASVVLD